MDWCKDFSKKKSKLWVVIKIDSPYLHIYIMQISRFFALLKESYCFLEKALKLPAICSRLAPFYKCLYNVISYALKALSCVFKNLSFTFNKNFYNSLTFYQKNYINIVGLHACVWYVVRCMHVKSVLFRVEKRKMSPIYRKKFWGLLWACETQISPAGMSTFAQHKYNSSLEWGQDCHVRLHARMSIPYLGAQYLTCITSIGKFLQVWVDRT